MAAEANLARLQKKLDTNDLSTKPRNVRRRNETMRKMRDRSAQLNKELNRRRKEAKVGQFSDAARIERQLKSIDRRRREVARRRRQKDYAPKEKAEPITDEMVDRAKAKLHKSDQALRVAQIKDKRARRTKLRKTVETGMELYWVTGRTLKTAYDMGTIGRQLHVASMASLFRRPGVLKDALPKNFTFTLEGARRMEATMRKDPLYNYMSEIMKIQFTSVDATSIVETEEAFRSALAEAVPGVKWSKYSYVTGINAMRYYTAKSMLESMNELEQGVGPDSQKSLKWYRKVTIQDDAEAQSKLR